MTTLNNSNHDGVDMTGGSANIGHFGEAFYHRQGNLINHDDSPQVMAQKGGIDFEYKSVPMVYGVEDASGSMQPMVVPNQKIHIRDDTSAYMGSGSDSFKHVQPIEAIEFYSDLVSDGQFEMNAMGSLKGGRTIFALAKSKDQININGDRIDPYLFFSTSAGGTGSTQIGRTTIRVQCLNYLTMALKQSNRAGNLVKVRHNTTFDADSVKIQLGLTENIYADYETIMRELINAEVSPKQAVQFYVDLYGKTDSDGAVVNEKALKTVMPELLKTLKHGKGQDHINCVNSNGANTAYGLLQSLTHYVDHNTRSKNDENRFVSAQFGDGAKMKEQAVDNILELVRS